MFMAAKIHFTQETPSNTIYFETFKKIDLEWFLQPSSGLKNTNVYGNEIHFSI